MLTKFNCFILTSLVIINMILGSVLFLDRVPIYGYVSLNHISIFFMVILSLFYFKWEYCSFFILTVIVMMPVFISISFSLPFSNDFGFDKSVNLYLISTVCISTFVSCIYSMGKEDRKLIFKYLAYFLIFFLFIALLFKLKNGLFNRDVKFIMLGPIVFGRLMGIGLLLSIFSIDSKYKNIIALSFLFGVLLSFSKGPILSLSLVFLLYLFLNKKIKSLLFLSVFIFLTYLNVNSVINYFISFDIPSLSRILNVIYVLVNGGDVTNGSNYGSIGSRSDMYKATINLIQLHPLGVGVGLWSNYISIEGLKYPHNLFLEVFSELGVFLGVLFLIPFLLFLLVRKNNQMLFLICMFLLFNQMVSGSIVDARYLLFFSVVSAFLYWNDRGTNKGINKG